MLLITKYILFIIFKYIIYIFFKSPRAGLMLLSITGNLAITKERRLVRVGCVCAKKKKSKGGLRKAFEFNQNRVST